jgi:serine/threonine-protein kinase
MPKDGPRTADAEPAKPEEAAGDVAADMARLGERLGRYQLVLPLGQGGMGIVFAGRLVGSHGLERLVAIKTLRPITSASHRSALLREARLTSRLHHRNVVATLDLDEIGDVPYVVMELVDGVSLAKLLATLEEHGERLAPELAAWIGMQCALGLHAAHELLDGDGRSLGLVHRDVSPHNILTATSGEVKIADFGIAKFAGRDESTETGTIKGKFGYMSPEQAAGEAVDRRSDVFALGIVLWEALTGEKLFATDNPARTLLRIREHHPRSPAEVRPDVGAELAAVTLRCLEKDPGHRYVSATDVAEALRGALRSRGSLVDESDLAGLVQRFFGAERAEFMRRVRSDAPMNGGRQPATRADEQSGSLALDASPGLGTRRPSTAGRRVRALTIAGVAVTLGSGAFFLWGGRPAPRVPPNAAHVAPDVPASTDTPLSRPSPEPLADPAPPSFPTGPSAAPAPLQPPAPKRATPTGPRAKAPAGASADKPTPPAAGTPFPSL